VDERLLDLLLPPPAEEGPKVGRSDGQGSPTSRPSDHPASAPSGVFVVSPAGSVTQEADAATDRYKRTRDKLRQLLLDG
jgi:hypothetical protein